MSHPVGLVDVGVWMPERWMTAAEIASASGIPQEVIVERFGLDGKHVAGPDDHVSTMGTAAGRQALERASVTAAELDLVVYFGSMWKDYDVWSAAPKLPQPPLPVHVQLRRRGGGGPRPGPGPRDRRLGHHHRRQLRRRRGGVRRRQPPPGVRPRHGRGDALPGRRQRGVDAGPARPGVRSQLRRRGPPGARPGGGGAGRRGAAGAHPLQAVVLRVDHRRAGHSRGTRRLPAAPRPHVRCRPLVGVDLWRDRLRPGDPVLLLAAGTGYTWAANVLIW